MEELNQALAVLINQATMGIDSSVDFLQAQLPEVVEQLLVWHGVKSIIFCLLGPAVIYGSYWLAKKYINFMGITSKTLREHPEVIVFSFIALFPVFGGIYMLNLTWLQIWIAPKVWLIEYAANLVK